MKTPSDSAETNARSRAAATRSTGERVRALGGWPRRHPRASRWLLLGLVFACGLTLFPQQAGFRRSSYKTNVAAPGTIVAKFDFPVLKDPARLREEQQAAMAAVPPVLVRHDSIAVAAAEKLESLRRRILELRRNRVELEPGADEAGLLPPDVYLTLYTQDAEAIFREAATTLQRLHERGVVSAETADKIADRAYVTLVAQGRDRVVPAELLATPERIRTSWAQPIDRSARAVGALVEAFAWPNVTSDENAWRRMRELARDGVDPALHTVARGDTIVEVRQVVDGDILRAIESYEAARERRAPGLLLRERLLAIVGRMMILALALTAMVLYLQSFRPEVLQDSNDTLLLASAFALFFLLGGIILNVLHLSPYLIPVAAFAVLIGQLYEERVALVASGIMATTIGLVTAGGLDFIVVIGFGAIAAILSVRELRDRRQLYRLLLFVPLAHLAARSALALVHSAPFAETLSEGLYLVANPFISAGIGLFAVPISENLFGKCTNLTLLELLDLNRPLLRRLMLEAPGSYHHALMVGTLAEAGASAIGANPLLARVIGYYHDIGKIRKPDYFIENLTAGSRNPHDRLAPAMSRLILEAHVRDGVALARESRLPQIVQDGIAQHHARSLMAYFYHKALARDPSASEMEYRYPGPRPRTREAAIVMLADQVDAAARSLEEPTPSRLRGLVKQLFEKRAMEGELDESRLTLKDLADMREAFTPILTALFHGRISYPTTEPQRGKSSSRPAVEQTTKIEP